APATDAPDVPIDAGTIDAASIDAASTDATGADAALPDASVDAAAGTGRFRTVGGLAQPRLQHAAALLPDGRVLVVGGLVRVTPDANLTPTAHAEVFDPVKGTF